ncbi:hypothetical protein TNCV_4684841 [Trichonephila clavipes]|nr:hypothetical protein TNCV_4684841 [Trichonephila clavipes]
MFLAGHPSHGCFGLQSHCAPCYFFNQASFYPSDFSFSCSPGANEDIPRREAESIDAHCPHVGVVRKLEKGVLVQVSFSSIDRGSKVRGPSPTAFLLLMNATLTE